MKTKNNFKIALLNQKFCTIGIRNLLVNFDYKILAFDLLNETELKKFNPSIIILETVDSSVRQEEDIKSIVKVRELLPASQVIVISHNNNLIAENLYIEAGAFWVFSAPLSIEYFQTIVAKALIFSELCIENELLKNKLKNDLKTSSPYYKSETMEALMAKLSTVAPLDIGILLEGESGTGKTMFADYIHKESKRNDSPFVSVSCAALPRDLLEAELFGYEKGAFTGATSKHIGSFEQADGGTLFLDEIGELPIDLQAKLLTVLQDFKIKRLGSTKTKKVDVRVITATNRNLKKMISDGEFREDLYYRIQVMNFTIPPLRDRKDDISGLVIKILDRICKKRDIPLIKINKDASNILSNYNWPGNVRELNNVLEKASVFCSNSIITKKDLDFLSETKVLELEEDIPDLSGFSIKEIESKLIVDTLKSCSGSKPLASKKLGISLKSLYNKLNKIDDIEINYTE